MEDNVTRESVLKLMEQKDEIEKNLHQLKQILDGNGVGMNDSLVDADGYPRQDIDVYQVRHARHTIICLQNDHKALMKRIELGIHALHSQNNASPHSSTSSRTREHASVPIAKVSYVEPGSPADLAGLRVDDFILEYGTIKYDNFKSLKDIGELTQHSIGRQIVVTVRRREGLERLILVPNQWRGKGLLGCNILPLEHVDRGRKRKLSEESDTYDFEDTMHLSKKRKMKKKLLSTPQYIYQALFKDGTDSDITLMALGKEWKLHKVYLCQSPYFASMFSGSWKEANESVVNIQIIDPKITAESLYTVLGSLYFNELDLEPGQLVSVLATAALFQLDSMCERCAEVMIETLDVDVVLSYYDAAVEYGVSSLKDASFNWLLANLLTCIKNIPEVLSAISVELMTALISSPNLFVIQTESSIYFLLQTWMYYVLNAGQRKVANRQQVLSQSSEYFQNLYDGTEFLLTEKGRQFAPSFRALRVQHLINLLDDMNRIQADRILPAAWMDGAISKGWISLLKFDHGLDRGPRECTEEELTREGIRCGRVLPDEGEHMWRWTGFYGGLDLVWTCKQHSIKVRRNHRNNDVGSMLSMAKRRYIVCRITVAKLNSQRQIEYLEKSPIQTFRLLRHDEVIVMNLKSDITFPVYLLCELLLTKSE